MNTHRVSMPHSGGKSWTRTKILVALARSMEDEKDSKAGWFMPSGREKCWWEFQKQVPTVAQRMQAGHHTDKAGIEGVQVCLCL